ncbi:hypothetical protein [Pseudoduganella rhizocola]|uniref:hypothetical protein n=1 Tax=Pseudoduganella rhizocola TaxID=3382643 RepID=UPI0038B46626
MDEAKTKVDEAVTQVDSTFLPCTYPIYAFVDGKDPTLIGTCFALSYRARNFLVTAAHVIDNSKKASLAFGTASGAMVIIEGEFYVTSAVGIGREEDPWDFAWHELTEEEGSKISCVPESSLEIVPNPLVIDKVHVALGYPVSKNKKISPERRRARKLTPVVARYMNLQTDAAVYFQERGMSSETHIAIKRENRSLNQERVEGNTIGHIGLSGGPLIDTGMQLDPPGFFPPKLSGILIEGDKNSQKSRIIVAVRISVILRHIDAQDVKQRADADRFSST